MELGAGASSAERLSRVGANLIQILFNNSPPNASNGFPAYHHPFRRSIGVGTIQFLNGKLQRAHSKHFLMLLVPPYTRLDVPVEQHFRDNQDMYLGKRRLIRELDVRPVTETHECVVDYVFKTILRGVFRTTRGSCSCRGRMMNSRQRGGRRPVR